MNTQPICKIDANGNKYWYLNGELHREDGPAIEYTDGGKSWYLNGERHREDGPAFERACGDKYWCLNGKRHREDGPAVECSNGNKYWYLNGKELTEEEFNKAMKTPQTNDGGSAFPRQPNEYIQGSEGMSLRDWFAGKAMAGLLPGCESFEADNMAKYAYAYADAMIAAREAAK